MKKRYLVQAVLLGCILIAGCGTAQEENTVSVLEIPIEENTESTIAEQEVFPVMPETESVVFEDVEVEVNGDRGTILVGTTGAPFTELLTQAKLQLAKDGWDLQIIYYDNIGKLNEDVFNSVLDAHLFAHHTYMESYNEVNKTGLVCVAPVCYEVYGVYSKSNEDLTGISDAVIALPKEEEKKARALLFMQDLGWITLKEDAGMTTRIEDIEINDKNLQFAEYTQETLLDMMDESDYCIAGADMAIINGLQVEDDAIRTETRNDASAGLYASLLVTVQEKAEDFGIQVLADALASEEMKEYVSDTYKGALELMQ